MAKQVTDANTKALEFFKDWSNYLVVTTVAAVGWIATGSNVDFSSAWVRAVCILAFSLSIAFGILTLALIPLVQEQRKPDQSNYDVAVTYRTWWPEWDGVCRLKSLCFPQHILFLLGILAFALGTIGGNPQEMAGAIRWCIGIIVTLALFGAALLINSIWQVSGEPWARVAATANANAGRPS